MFPVLFSCRQDLKCEIILQIQNTYILQPWLLRKEMNKHKWSIGWEKIYTLYLEINTNLLLTKPSNVTLMAKRLCVQEILPLHQWFTSGETFCLPQGSGGCMLASSGWRPSIVSNILQCTRQTPQKRSNTKGSIPLRLRNLPYTLWNLAKSHLM